MTHQSGGPNAVAVDREAISLWCDVVFGYLEGLVPVRYLAEKGTPQKPPRQAFVPVSEVAARVSATAQRAAADQRAVFLVPGTVVEPGSARAKDIAQTGVILVDLDEGDIGAKLDHLIRYLGVATLAVASGGVTDEGQPKLHLFWRLKEAASGADLDTVAGLRETIARKAGCDASFDSLHQPIRVAGTIHGKGGVLSLVRILQHTEAEYDLAELQEVADAMPVLAGSRPGSNGGPVAARGPSAEELATRRIRAGNQDDVTRFKAMSRVIGHWIRNARRGLCSLEEALEAVLDHNTSMIVPPWEDLRVRREFEALRKRDIERHGPFPDWSRTNGHAEDEGPVGAPPEHSDDALAATFAAQESSRMRHVPVFGSWYLWNGQVWGQDETGLTRERMRRVCRASAALTEKPGEARRIASDKTIAAALRIAASDPRIARRASDWDAHPMLLNTPAGIVDLATGEVLPHDPALLLTQITAASPGRDCSRWRAFLEEITGGDRDLEAYLQRLAGYCLTGDISEQVFAFLHGTGGNGKSVFLDVIAGTLGSYAATAALETFMETRAGRHLTELAGLRAARLVLVTETETGKGWAETRIKTVTGGESLRVNFMHRDHFEYRPQFKLLVAGNHRPTLTGVGEAMRRRLHLVPFDVTIPADRRDRALAGKLRDERDGILGWMLEGCADWQRSGLRPPRRVLEAAEDYFESEDLVGQWLAARCDCRPELRATSAVLFQSWKDWADQHGHPAGSTRALGEALRSRGFRDAKIRGDRGWLGLAPHVRPAPEGEDSP